MIRRRETRRTLTFNADPNASPNAPEIFTISLSSVLAPYADINGPGTIRGDLLEAREELDRNIARLIANLPERAGTDPLIAIQLVFTADTVYIGTLRRNVGYVIVGTLQESPHDVLFHLSPLMTDEALQRCKHACRAHHQCWIPHGRYVVSFCGFDSPWHASVDALRTA